MDMVTLAMAKAHTDSKVGGSGYPSAESAIDLDTYGFDILPIIHAGGGIAQYEGTAGMWECLDANRNSFFSLTVSGNNVYLRPVYFSEDHGHIIIFALQAFLTVGNNIVANANIIFESIRGTNAAGEFYYDGGTIAVVTVTQAQIPG